jgi:serine/threonine protein kinase
MGTVFLAEQIGVGNRPVALKVLNRKLLDDPDFLLRFQNEAGSTGRIHHPNVVTIYESAQSDDGTPYIAMEFLEGESLREVLKRRGALPVPEVAEILQQAARGLNAAHKLGIIHRDLKPDNIFLTYPDDDSVGRVSPVSGVRWAPPESRNRTPTASAPVFPSAPAVTLASPPAQIEGAPAPTSPRATVQVKIVDFGIEHGQHLCHRVLSVAGSGFSSTGTSACAQ